MLSRAATSVTKKFQIGEEELLVLLATTFSTCGCLWHWSTSGLPTVEEEFVHDNRESEAQCMWCWCVDIDIKNDKLYTTKKMLPKVVLCEYDMMDRQRETTSKNYKVLRVLLYILTRKM